MSDGRETRSTLEGSAQVAAELTYGTIADKAMSTGARTGRSFAANTCIAELPRVTGTGSLAYCVRELKLKAA
jgi:hypothetical protein